jgi:hypothetical protein
MWMTGVLRIEVANRIRAFQPESKFRMILWLTTTDESSVALG